MSILQYPKTQFHKQFAADEIVPGGSFIPDIDCELKYLRNYFLLNDVSALNGTERFRVIIYSDSNFSSALYTSSWANFSSIPNLIGPSWHGWLRSDFNLENLKNGTEYFFAIEIDNNVYDPPTGNFISLKYDFDNSVYAKVSNQFLDYPIAIEPYIYRVVEL